MKLYSVTKNYGHFVQCWRIKANTEEEAIKNFQNGYLTYQSCYLNDQGTDSFAKNLTDNTTNKISTSQYYEWMRDSISMGMKVQDFEYKKAFS